MDVVVGQMQEEGICGQKVKGIGGMEVQGIGQRLLEAMALTDGIAEVKTGEVKPLVV